MAIFALAHEPIPILNTESGTKISMATVNIMAEEMAVSELEEDQDLLIEALRKHLTYVEVNTTQLQNTRYSTHRISIPSLQADAN